jgi:hypothetical protein
VYISDLNKLINFINFISNADSLLEPDEEEFETTGIYYIACPVALIYIALKHVF